MKGRATVMAGSGEEGMTRWEEPNQGQWCRHWALTIGGDHRVELEEEPADPGM